jgi:MFS transporter, SP family, arabinose:H+ symporter
MMSTLSTVKSDSSRAPHSARYLLLLASVAALAGFLFGYDTAVVNGAIDFLARHFELDKDWKGFAASSLLVGCMLGAGMAGFLGDRFGRKWTLFTSALIFAVSSIASALPATAIAFVAARFVGGIAIGASSMLSPLYIAEIAPEKSRGRLVALYQLAIVTGILVVYFVNLQIQRCGDDAWNMETGWRWMFASLTLPSVLFAGMMLIVPESPRWLMKAGRRSEAQVVLERVGGAENAAREIRQIEEVLGQEEGRWRELFQPGYRRAVLIGSALAILGQFSGINAIIYYGKDIFEAAGAGTDAAFSSNVTIGLVNLVFTFVAIWLIDRAGRRPLLIAGTIVQVLSLSAIGLIYYLDLSSAFLLGSILVFIAAFANAMGPIPWILNSEIFPTKLRGRAMSVAILVLWLGDFIVTQTFPRLNADFGSAGTFWVYALCSLVSVFFVIFMVPETKGRTLEEIEESWRR